MIFNGSPDERDIILQALEMWIGNEHDDIHEMGDDEPNKADRERRVRDAETLFAQVAREGGYK
jgi:hypothetical protein